MNILLSEPSACPLHLINNIYTTFALTSVVLSITGGRECCMQQTIECFVDYGCKASAEVTLMAWYALYVLAAVNGIFTY